MGGSPAVARPVQGCSVGGGVNSAEWELAETSADHFAGEIESVNRQLRKDYPGGSHEKTTKDLLAAQRFANQLAVQQVCRSHPVHC